VRAAKLWRHLGCLLAGVLRAWLAATFVHDGRSHWGCTTCRGAWPLVTTSSWALSPGLSVKHMLLPHASVVSVRAAELWRHLGSLGAKPGSKIGARPHPQLGDLCKVLDKMEAMRCAPFRLLPR
jgi:hypothetical protein